MYSRQNLKHSALNDMMHNKGFFLMGIGWLAFVLIAYFIPLTIDEGANYLVKDTLLGVMIAHNMILLILYILVGIAFISWGLKGKRIKLA